MAVLRVADRAAVKVALERWEAAAADLTSLSMDALSHKDLLAVADRMEAVTRRVGDVEHRVVGRLADEAAPREFGARNLAELLAVRLRISRGEASRRIADAHLVAPRATMTGEKLDPVLPNVAAGIAAGQVGVEALQIIRKFFAHLPSAVDAPTRETAERELAVHAGELCPEQLREVATLMTALIDPDGRFSEGERSRKRGIALGPQGCDGMSRLSGWVDPQLRATMEAVWVKLAAAGMANPDSPTPRVNGTATEEENRADLRSPGQRRHDGLTVALREVLASKKLGSHRGLPVTIVISTTLAELESGAGFAVTAGGTKIHMSDVIRLARHSHHYLAVFDGHTEVPLYLGRSKRIATPGQRLVLYARERGCSKPGCTVGAYWCEVHHCEEWQRDQGGTDITTETLVCKRDHRMIGPNGWITKKRADGVTQWFPPPELDTGGPTTNDMHHPERFLRKPHDDGRGG